MISQYGGPPASPSWKTETGQKDVREDSNIPIDSLNQKTYL